MSELDGLQAEFIAETREALERVQELLVAWEHDPASATDTVDEVFRFVHTVKGSCGFLDLPRIAALSHAAETVLGEVRDGRETIKPALASTLLATVDRIAALTNALDGSTDAIPDDDQILIERLANPVDTPIETDSTAVAAQPALRTVRLTVERLEQLMGQVSDLVLARNELSRQLRNVDVDRLGQVAFDRLSYSIAELRETVAKTRLQPIDRLFATLPRLVRDTSKACDKDVRLTIEGSEVEIDREMIESIRDPLTHVIRNAIDHGIEPLEARRAVGKPNHGTIRVIAQQSGNQVSITVADDGRGIDVQRLVQRAVSVGLMDSNQASALSPEAALDLIFSPGLSTASSVTEISGRGVGMDVVRVNLERIGGSIGLENRPGFGLAITLRAPLTLSIINALVVQVGAHQFGIPRAAIEEIVPIGSQSLRFEAIGGGHVAILRGHMLPVTHLRRQLQLEDADPKQLLIISTADGYRYAAAIDHVLDHEEVVVRPTIPHIGGLEIYAGQTLSDGGQPLLILDPSGLARDANIENRRSDVLAPVISSNVTEVRMLLFEGLDGKRRALRSKQIERLEEIDADQIAIVAGREMVCVDGVPIPAIGHGPSPETGVVAGIRLQDARETTVMYLAKSIQELAPFESFTPIEDDQIEGIVMVDGRPVEVIAWPPAMPDQRAHQSNRKAAA